MSVMSSGVSAGQGDPPLEELGEVPLGPVGQHGDGHHRGRREQEAAQPVEEEEVESAHGVEHRFEEEGEQEPEG